MREGDFEFLVEKGAAYPATRLVGGSIDEHFRALRAGLDVSGSCEVVGNGGEEDLEAGFLKTAPTHTS